MLLNVEKTKYLARTIRGRVGTFQNGNHRDFSKIGKMTHLPPKPKRKVTKYFSKFAKMTPHFKVLFTAFRGTFRKNPVQMTPPSVIEAEKPVSGRKGELKKWTMEKAKRGGKD